MEGTTTEEIARQTAEQIIRNGGDLRLLTIEQFVDRVAPIIKVGIDRALSERNGNDTQ